MKIIQLATFFHPVIGGVGTHVYSLSKQLLANGHQVEVLCSDAGNKNQRIRDKRDIVAGIPVRRFRTFFSFSQFHKFFPGVFLYLLKADYDLIHVHNFRKPESYMALIAGYLRKKPVIITTHNPFPATSRSLLQKIFIKVHDLTAGKYLSKYFAAVIYLVDSEKPLLTEQFKIPVAKLHKIPNGVENEYFTIGEAKNFYREYQIDPANWRGLVVGVGRLNYAKGFQNLYHAVNNLPDVLFFIAGGDDGYLHNLKQLYQNKSNIIFSERYLNKDKLLQLYAAADIFVLPSLYEPFGIVLLEAMAQKVPIIASDQGNAKEFLKGDYIEFLSPKKQISWTTAIDNLLKNPKLRQLRANNGFEIVQKYAWDKITKKIEKVYLQFKTNDK